MAFRKVGGTDRLKTNNYVSNNTANMVNANITDSLGKLNTKIVSQSHLDLQGQTLFNVGNVVFVIGKVTITNYYVSLITSAFCILCFLVTVCLLLLGPYLFLFN